MKPITTQHLGKRLLVKENYCSQYAQLQEARILEFSKSADYMKIKLTLGGGRDYVYWCETTKYGIVEELESDLVYTWSVESCVGRKKI